jgi:hypothetical protein
MEQVVVPITTPRPPNFRLTDSGDDFHIDLDQLGTFMAEMLVAAHYFEEREPKLPAMRPVLHDWTRMVFRKGPDLLPTPEVKIDHTTMRSSKRWTGTCSGCADGTTGAPRAIRSFSELPNGE